MRGVSEAVMFAGGPALVMLFVVQYVALRIRDTRATPQDLHLGRKSLLYFFVNAMCFLALVGLTISAIDWVEYLLEPTIAAQQARKNAAAMPVGPDGQPPVIVPLPTTPPMPSRDWFNDKQRLAAGLVTSGFLYGLLFWLIARIATNDRRFPAVRRAFAATRLAVAAVIVVTLGTIAIVQGFQRGETDYDQLAGMLGIAIVWGPTAVLHLLLVLRTSGWRPATIES